MDGRQLWSRYAFKLATGAGKTKVMSLAIVWSYFHALRESDSPMARHVVVIAPNLTVYERLKEDFGDARIFDTDPLIPPEWRGDWNMSVVLQDEASGAATGGVLYLTNKGAVLTLDETALVVTDRIEGCRPDGDRSLFVRKRVKAQLEDGDVIRAWAYRFARPKQLAGRPKPLVGYRDGRPLYAWPPGGGDSLPDSARTENKS